MWWGAFVCATPLFPDTGANGWATIASPLFTMLVLLFVSGLPTAEGANLARYYAKGKGEEWEEYTGKTSPLIPLPTALYHALPRIIKKLFCCEFGFLQYKELEEDVVSVISANESTPLS